jgi:hypothetical protein
MTDQIRRPPSNVKIFPPPAHGAAAPRDVLAWHSAAQRNRLLKLWRRQVLAIFGNSTRCIRLAWVLADLFNAKTGYAYPSNPYLAEETRMAQNKVQAALRELELGRAITRGWVTHNGQPQRVIYPSAALMPAPAWGTPRVGVGEDPQQPGVLNLRRRPSTPKTELQRARLAAEIRERNSNPSPETFPPQTPVSVEAKVMGVGHREPSSSAASSQPPSGGNGQGACRTVNGPSKVPRKSAALARARAVMDDDEPGANLPSYLSPRRQAQLDQQKQSAPRRAVSQGGSSVTKLKDYGLRRRVIELLSNGETRTVKEIMTIAGARSRAAADMILLRLVQEGIVERVQRGGCRLAS